MGYIHVALYAYPPKAVLLQAWAPQVCLLGNGVKNAIVIQYVIYHNHNGSKKQNYDKNY